MYVMSVCMYVCHVGIDIMHVINVMNVRIDVCMCVVNVCTYVWYVLYACVYVCV